MKLENINIKNCNRLLCKYIATIERSKRIAKRFYSNVVETLLYWLLHNKYRDLNVKRIIIICQGNICRSAFAEHWCRLHASGKNIQIQSCGVHVNQSTSPPSDAVKTGQRFGVDLSGHTSKSIDGFDLAEADLVVAMQYSHWRRLTNLAPELRRKTVLLREFAPFPHNMLCNIYDPYGHGQDEFDRCFGLMEKALKGLMARIREDS